MFGFHIGQSTAEQRGQLFLIVGFPEDDYQAGFDAWSAYSAFTGLLRELKNLPGVVKITKAGELYVNFREQLETEKGVTATLRE
jgi:hypothetical protein